MTKAVIVFLCLIISGCSTAQQWGIRPEEPPLVLTGDPCQVYQTYLSYVQSLRTAYYARATGNRGATYAGGVLAAGTGTGAAALALESTPAVGTMGAFTLFESFLSNVLHVVDNPQLASVYTLAANGLGLAVVDSYTAVVNATDQGLGCKQAFLVLLKETNITQNNLELARTDAAAAGLQKALAQAVHFQEMTGHGPEQAHPSLLPVGVGDSASASLSRLEAVVQRLEALQAR